MALTKISTAMISQSAAAVDLNVDAGTFYVDTTNNRVGVGGKTDPDTPLHVIGTVTATTFAGSGASLTNIPNSALTNSSITINSNAVSLGGSLTLTTANIAENTNLYYTDARADARANARITATLIDEDDMSSNSASRLPSQQSVKAYVDSEVAGLVDSAPGTLNTLNELAAALGDDASFSTTVTNSIATKLPLSGGTLTGTLTGVGVVTNGPRNIIQRSNDDSSIAFANNASGTPASHTWATGLNYSNSNAFTIAYGSSGIPSLELHKMVITTAGDVGIGTDSPQEKLHIYTTGNSRVEAESTTGFAAFKATNNSGSYGWYVDNNADKFHLFDFTDSANRISVDGSGNVGIGTTNPAALLHLKSTANTAGPSIIFENTNNAQAMNIDYYSNAGSVQSRIQYAEGPASWNFIPNTSNSNSALYIAYDGRVGVGGNTNPTTTLDLTKTNDSGERAIRIENSSARVYIGVEGSSGNRFVGSAVDNAFIGTTTSDGLELATANTVRAVIDTSGNFGIGTTSPSQKLDVSGRIKSNDGLLSNAFQVYNTGTTGFLIELDVSSSNYAHIHGTIKLQQFNVSSQQIIAFSATTLNNGTLQSYAATADIDVTIKLFVYNSKWHIHVPSPSTYSDISAYIHLGAGYQGGSRGSNCIVGISSAAVPSSGVTGSVDIVAQKRVLANTSGNVGIGAASPNSLLELETTATSAAGGLTLTNTNASGYSTVQFKNTGGTGQTYTIALGGSSSAFSQKLYIYDDTDSAARIVLDHAGNVGIGTDSPATKLDVDGSLQLRASGYTTYATRMYSRLDSTHTSVIESYINSNTAFEMMGTYADSAGVNPRIVIGAGGQKVGIGITNPYFPLHVQGANLANGAAKTTALFFDTTSAAAGTGGGIALGGYTNGTGGDLYHFGNIQGIKENSTAGNYDSAMIFSTRVNGATPTEKLRITSGGQVLVGTGGSTLVDSGNTNFNMVFPDNGGIAMGSAYTFANIYGNSGNVYIRANAYPANTGSDAFIKLQTGNSSGGQANDITIKAGKLGIDITNPLSPLSVQADSGAGVARFVGRSSDNIASVGFYNYAQSADIYLQSNGSWFRSRAGSGFHFARSTTPTVTDTDGFTIQDMNLGIGTTDPSCRLEVVNTGEARIKARSTSNNWAGLDLEAHGTQSNYIFFRDNSAERARIQVVDGNDIIFLTGSSPDEKMKIQGSDGKVTVNNRFQPNEHIIFGSSTGYLQFPGSGGRAWAMASSGGTAAPGTQAATFGMHHWNGSAWSNPVNITSSGKLGIGTDNPDTPLEVRNSADTTGKTARFVNTGTSVDGITVGTSTSDSSGRALHLGHNNSGGKGYVHGYNYGSGAWDSVEVKGANVNLRASNNYDMVRIGPNFWSLGGGTTSHGRVRSYHHAVSVSAGTTIQLLTNNSGAHTDVNFLYWIEAFHSGRTYRTGVGTFGGYGLYTSSAGQGLNFSIASVSTGVKRLEIVANSSFTTVFYIGMIIFGDTALTVHNGTLADMI